VPHTYAGNEHDLYLATGYISAQERLWQMDLIRPSSGYKNRVREILQGCVLGRGCKGGGKICPEADSGE